MTRLLVLGGSTPTRNGLLEAARKRGMAAEWLPADEACRRVRPDDTVLGLVDVRPTLDGITPGLDTLRWLATSGVSVLNRAETLAMTHDKLAMDRSLSLAGIRRPRTVEIISRQMPLPFRPPFVVKPRFGNRGRETFLCSSESEFRALLSRLKERSWFALGGALAQEVVPHTALEDVRVVVAGGSVVGANRHRTTVRAELSGDAGSDVRRFAVPPVAACACALAAARAVGADLVSVDLLGGQHSYTVSDLDCCVDLTDNFGLDIFDLTVHTLLAARR